MLATLGWTAYRLLRKKETYILLAVLAFLALVLTGIRHINGAQDLSLLNLAYGTDFLSMEEFLAWYDLWAYQWVVSSLELLPLLPIAASIFPDADAPEWKVPVVQGHPRWHAVLSALVCYVVEILILTLCATLLAIACNTYRWSVQAPISFYVRTFALRLYLMTGFALLALAVVLLFRKRILGIIVGTLISLLLTVSANRGFYMGTPLWELLPKNSRKLEVWMWQVEPVTSPQQIARILLFPLAAAALATGVALWRYRRRDLC